MNRALYPGSFDPFTNGHLSVLEKAVNLFDEVVVAISTNPAKKRRFERENAFYAICKMLEEKPYKDKVHVIITTDSIPARIAENWKCNYIIRGIRNDMDYNYEEGLAQYNAEYNKHIETIYFRAENSVISSTMVFSFIKENVPVDKYLPYDKGILYLVDANNDNVSDVIEMKKYLSERVEKENKWLSELQASQV